MKNPAVYILASKRNGTLYIGVTSDLIKRVWQHREGLADGFTKMYNVKMLVWYERHETMESAIAREKAMKKWLRKWKLEAIEKTNPNWLDLWPQITGEAPKHNAMPSSINSSQADSLIPEHTTSVIPAVRKPSVIPVDTSSVIPAEAGIQEPDSLLDSRFRGNDDEEILL